MVNSVSSKSCGNGVKRPIWQTYKNIKTKKLNRPFNEIYFEMSIEFILFKATEVSQHAWKKSITLRGLIAVLLHHVLRV